ncbi:MAG: HlyD family efflux transporter periplasmic adaptor subunit [Pseudomonadota bacterium]
MFTKAPARLRAAAITFGGLLTLPPAVALAQPLLTGVVEDVQAQTIEMPSLPGAWQRRIEWMAVEGSQVAVGDVVVRLDPGDLISREEQTRTDLEKTRLSAARRVDEKALEVMDAERAVTEARSQVRLAELDAVIPEETIARLDYERYQLALEIWQRELIRFEAQLLNARQALDDVKAETALEVEQANSRHERIRAALEATQIKASKPGFVLYGSNPFTGRKIFPGETHYGGFEIAQVASREDLQVKFWVHEADIRKLRPGLRLTITADAQGLEPFDAEVSWASSQATERQDWSPGGYFEVIARPVTALPERVMPGMSVKGEPNGDQSS